MEIMDYEPYPLVQQHLEGDLDLMVLESGLTKLIFKLNVITKSKEMDFSEECQTFIYDYLIVFMKMILRAMAEQKRKFRVYGCPLLIGIKPESQYLKPWESRILKHKLSTELLKSIQENDELEEELESRAAITKVLKKMDETAVGRSKTKGGLIKNDKTKDGKQEQSEEPDKETYEKIEKSKYDDILHSHIKEKVKSELVYSNYTVKDLLNLLEHNPLIIPKNSIRHVLRTNAAKKVKAKPTNVIF